MPKFFVKQNQIKNNQIEITGQDVNHIKNVLRKKEGKKIEICNSENSQDYLCEIIEIKEEKIKCKIKEKIENEVESNIKVSIFQGLPKADKMELIIQKSVELGAYEITPVEMERCVVKLKENDKLKKISRWQKISEVAAKQCGRNIIPQINNITKIKNICNLIPQYDIVLLAYEDEKENTLKRNLENLKKIDKKELKIAIIIGPEGGITTEEVQILKQSGAEVITLGKRILRTETVALNMVGIIMYELEEI